jgi:HEAT repeat protein
MCVRSADLLVAECAIDISRLIGRLTLPCCVLALLAPASAQLGRVDDLRVPRAMSHAGAVRVAPRDAGSFSAARGPDWYGGWMMWWSANREEFLHPGGAASRPTSRPADALVVRPVDEDAARARIMPTLVGALKDGERRIRETAAIAVGTCGDEREVGALVKLLDDRDRAVVEATITGLGLLGVPSADAALAKILADPSMSDRARGLAALALGLSGGDGARKPLLDGLGSWKSDSLEACRMVGAGLWAGGDVCDLDPARRVLVASQIQKGLTSQQSRRRKLLSIGIAALSKARDPGSVPFVLETLRDPRFDLRAAAAIAAGRVIRADDKKSVQALIGALSTEAHTLPSRFMIISLGRIGGKEALQHLKWEFGSGDKTRCAFAALALGIGGAADFAPRLRQDVTGPTEDRMRGAFAVALGLLRDPEAFATIVRIARGKANDELVAHCAWFFALSQNAGAVPVVEKILETSRVAETQEAAALALGILGAAESQPLLARLLGKSSESTRKAAAVGLGRMRDERGVEPLLKAAKGDRSVPVRAAAIAALGEIARRSERPPFARVAIDSYYGLQNEAIDEIATRAGSLMKSTEEGGAQRQR